MTARGDAIAEQLRDALARLADLDKTAPADVDRIVGMLVAHLRAWRPVAISPLGTLPAPTETIRDPRSTP